MSRAFLRKARRKGQGPRYVRIGATTIRYSVSDLREWIDAQLVG
jgi:predicted DNA-binding transcriptional regulator AlpA